MLHKHLERYGIRCWSVFIWVSEEVEVSPRSDYVASEGVF